MRKVIKIIVQVLSSVVLAAIILPFVVALLLNIGSVQNFIAHKAASFASRKLGTEVSVGGLRITGFNKVEIGEFYVEDYYGDTLVYAGALSANLNKAALFRGNVVLGDVSLRDAQLNLFQPEEGEMNLKQILDRLSKRDSLKEKKGSVVALNDIDISGFTFSYRRGGAPRKEAGIDFADMRLTDMSVRSRGLRISGDTIAMDLDGLRFREKSGFAVENLSAERFSIIGPSLNFDGLVLNTSYSSLDIPRLRVSGSDWGVFKYFTDSVRLEAGIRPSVLDTRTLAWFAPALALKSPLRLTGLALDFSGTPNDFSGRLSSVSAEGTFLAADFSVRGVTRLSDASFALGIDTLRTDAASAGRIMRSVSGSELPDSTAVMLARLGTVGMEGRFEGAVAAFTADARVSTALGGLAVNGRGALPAGGGKSFDGRIGVDGFDVGGLLHNPRLGRLFASAALDASDIGPDMNARADLRIAGFRFGDYVYRDITLDGVYAERGFKGQVVSRDPNALATFDGYFDLREQRMPRYDFMLDAERVDLAVLGLMKADSVAVLSFGLSARGRGLDPDDFTGTAVIRGLTYVSSADTLNVSEIRLVGDNSPESKYLSLVSPFADAEFRSYDSYRTVFGYLKYRLAAYLPGLGRETVSVSGSVDATDIKGYSTLTLRIKEADRVTEAFLPALHVADSTSLRVTLNPDADKFMLSLRSPYVEWNNFLVTGLDISSQNISDSLVLYMRTGDAYAGSYRMPALMLTAGAGNDMLDVSAGFGGPDDNVSARLGLMASFGSDSTGMPNIRVHFRPSTFTENGSVWDIASRQIVYDSTRLQIDGFRITNRGQGLYVNGAVSDSRSDTLRVRLSSLNLAPFSQFTASAGYTFSGILNGEGRLVSARSNPVLTATLDMDSLGVNEIAVAPLAFDSRWDFGSERARFSLVNKLSGNDVIRGYYRPSDGAYMADLNLGNLPLVLLDPILKGVLGNTEGFADATLSVRGKGGSPSIDGVIRIPRLVTTVDFTGATYRLDNGEIVVADNVLTLKPNYLYDTDGNKAAFGLTFDASNFSNLSYDVSVKPDRFMALNTTAQQSDIFYGKVYASGTVSIKGDKRGIKMDIVAATEDNSVFYMPLKGASNVTDADFITFVHRQRPDTSNYLVRRRMMYEHRTRKPQVKADMDINIALNIRPNIEVELQIDPTVDNTLRARGTGTLNLHINPARGVFTIYGGYEITNGSYTFNLENLVTKQFEIQQGSSIQWSGDPLDAILNITAVYRLRTSLAGVVQINEAGLTRNVQVDCIIKLTGPLSQPNITFDVEVPNAAPEIQSLLADILNTTQEMMATQFLYLLVFNQFYTDSGSAATNIGMSGGSIGFSFLTNQINKIFSSDDFRINVSYRQKSELTSDEIDFSVQKDLWNDRLILEFEGNYDTGNNATSVRNTNMTAGGTLTWVVDRSGRLLLKIFSRTIDRFDENQGLQENGVGIYFSQDFDTFKELWARFRRNIYKITHRSDEKRAARIERKSRRHKPDAHAGGEHEEEAPGEETYGQTENK